MIDDNTLRNLGNGLLAWLLTPPEWTQPQERLALDVVRLEWAHVEAFDAADEPIVGPEDLLEVTPGDGRQLKIPSGKSS